MMEQTNAQLNMYSRKEINQWLKSQPYSQNLNDGVLFCRVMQKSFPAYFIRLNDNPRNQFECICNFKMLNRCLDKNNLFSITDLQKFAASKDFFQFVTWLRNFVDRNQSSISGTAIHMIEKLKKQEHQPAAVRSPPIARIKTMSVTNTVKREEMTPAQVNDFDIMAASSKDVRAFAHTDDFGDYLKREDTDKKKAQLNQILPKDITSALPPRADKNARGGLDATQSAKTDIDFYQVYQNDVKALLQLNACQTDIEYLKQTLDDLKQIIESSRSVESLKAAINQRIFRK